MTEKIYIVWDELHRDIKNLCSILKNEGRYNKIVAVSRGGLLPAGIIAYELDIRNTAVVNVSTYVGNEHLRLDEIADTDGVGCVDEHTLIVDDLVDSGQTFRVMRKQFPKGKFVSVYAKEKGANEVDVYARKMPDQWIVFPWDKD